jgi:hypothetical protein
MTQLVNVPEHGEAITQNDIASPSMQLFLDELLLKINGSLLGPAILHVSYTVSSVPLASSWTGGLIYVTDAEGGPVLAFSDGSNWLRASDLSPINSPPTGGGGPAGPTGPAGADGTNGTNGTDGADGTNGTNGTDGADGAEGPAGPDGPTGPAGPAGGGGNPAQTLAFTGALSSTTQNTNAVLTNFAWNDSVSSPLITHTDGDSTIEFVSGGEYDLYFNIQVTDGTTSTTSIFAVYVNHSDSDDAEIFEYALATSGVVVSGANFNDATLAGGYFNIVVSGGDKIVVRSRRLDSASSGQSNPADQSLSYLRIMHKTY